MSGPTTVNISGTFSEKQRPNNGMERVATFLNNHRLARIPVVGYCEWHSHGETRTGEKMAVVLPAIEPGVSPTGGEVPGLPVQDGFPTDAGGQIMWLLDSIRRSQGKGAVADTLFSVPSEDIHAAADDDEEETRYEGEVPIPGADPVEVRVGSDGEHVVPPPSGEELTAELDERRAEAAKASAVEAASEVANRNRIKPETRKAVTGSAEAPPATFTPPPGGDAA